MSASLLLQIAVKVSILLAMAWLVTRAMRRSSASARHFVWAIAIVAVLFVPVMVLVGPAWQIKILPATLTAVPQPAAERFDAAQSDSGVGDRFESGNSTPSIPPTHSTHSTASESTVSAAERSTGSGSAVSEVSPGTLSSVEGSTLTRVEAATSASQDPTYWQPWLLGLWAAGVAFVLLRLGIGIVWVCWTARRAEPIIDAVWLSILEEVTTTLQFTGRVSLRRSGRTTVPVACGIWRPTLLMPLDADEWSADRRRVVLLHELAHVKRRDCRLQAIAQVAYAWHWFNPLVHVAVARLRAEQERACDDLVLAAGTDGPAYADHLFEIARAFRSDALPRWAMLAMAAPSQLEGRVLAILDAHQRRHVLSRVSRFVVASVVAVTVLTLSAFRLSATSDETLPDQLEAIDSNIGADDTQSADIDVDFDSVSLATPDITLVSPVDSAPPDLPQVAAQGPDPRFNPWLDGLRPDLPFDFVPPIDLQINVDPNPDPNPDFDFNFDFDFDFDPPVVGFVAPPGSQTPADGVPDETRRRVADALSLAINDENPRVRAQAIQGLAAMRDPRAVPALVKALQSPDVRLRRIAVNSLGQFDTPEAAQGLVGALKDENPDVRRVAISALSRRRDEKYADAIAGALKDQNPDVRRQAVAALGRAGQSAAVVGALVQALKDSDADVRERAAGSLGRVRSTEAVPALIAALKDANAEVRKMSAIALGSIADSRAIDALTAALKDMDAEVREHAARALGRIARGQRRGPGRFPVANLDFKELEREIEKVQKVEIDKVHRVYQDMVNEKHLSWSLGSLDPHEMVDAAMRQADKAFKQYEENWRQLEQKGWTGKN